MVIIIALATTSACVFLKPIPEEETEMEEIYPYSPDKTYVFEIMFEADSTLQPDTANLGGNRYRYKVERRKADTIKKN